MNKFLIKAVMAFRNLWKSMGVNPEHLEIILETKLKMDGRRKNTFTKNMNTSNSSNTDLIAMGVFFLMGALFIMILISFPVPATGISFYLTIWMILLLFTLVAEFTDVLIDVSDNYILLPRPVHDKTITIARVLHIFLYLSRLVIAFGIPGVIYMVYAKGLLGGFVFTFQILATVLFAVFFVNVLYLLILRFTTQEKFKEVINYFQIGFVVFILVGYHLLPRLIDFDSLTDFNILDSFAAYFIPTVWIGSWWSVLVEWNLSLNHLILAGLGIVFPLICLWLVVNVFSKNFSQKLIGISQGKIETPTSKKTKSKAYKNPWMNAWKKLTVRSKEEAVGFESTWLLTERSRKFKLKIYPLFGYIPAYFIYIGIGGKGSLNERWTELKDGQMYIFLLYLAVFASIMIIFNIRYSERAKASWPFYALPLQKPGRVLKGSLKAVISRFSIPFYVVISIMVFAIWGTRPAVDIFVGFVNIVFFSVMIGRMAMEVIPFSEPWENQSRGDNLGWSMISSILLAALGFMHWFWMDSPMILLGWCVIAIVLTYLFLKDFDKATWKSIK